MDWSEATKQANQLLTRIENPTKVAATFRLPPQIESLCSHPLLGKDDEREVFRLMNFFKFRVNSFRSSLDPNRPSIRKVREMDDSLLVAGKLHDHAVQANTRLVVSIVRKFVNDRSDFEELLSEGLTCLIRVVEKFDYGRGFRFSTYATWSIKNRMLRFRERAQRQADRYKTGVEILAAVDSQVEDDRQVVEVIDRETSTILKTAMNVLNDRERLVIESRCGFRLLDVKPTLKNIGEMLGVCKERVRQIERRGMDKLRDRMLEMNIDLEQ